MCDLNELITIVDTLQQLSARFYGPRCKQTLLTSNTGKAVITSDGLTILEAVSLSHPMANMVVTSLKKCHAVTYDGSKTFLLYLKFFLKHLKDSTELGKFSGSGINHSVINNSHYSHNKICAAKTILWVLDSLLPDLYKDLLNHNSVKLSSSGNVREILNIVAQTTLLPHFNVGQCRQLANTLAKVVPYVVSLEAIRDVLKFEILKFSQLMVKVSGRNYTECEVCEPFLLKKSKLFKNFIGRESGSCHKAVCLQISSEDSELEETEMGLVVNDKDQIHCSLLVKRKAMEMFAEACLQLNIELIICCDSLPAYALDALHKHKLSVLTNVLKEDIDLLEIFTHTTSLESFAVEIKEINVMSIGSIEEVTIGNEQFLHLKTDAFRCQNSTSPIDATSFKHVVVCAPSAGLCDQTALLLQKALNAMSMSLEGAVEINASYDGGNVEIDKTFECKNPCSKRTSNKETRVSHDKETIEETSLSHDKGSHKETNVAHDNETHKETSASHDKITICEVLPAGGAFEIMMSKMLQDKCKPCDNPHIKEICLIMSEALIEVVKVLYDNTSQGRRHRPRFIHLQTQLYDRMGDCEIAGLNSKGEVCAKDEQVFLEPLRTKVHVLESVLSLVAQILRIDDIIPIKIKNSRDTGE